MYRETEFADPCVECGQPSSTRCARCGDPCCAKHVYSDDPTCAECEGEFLRVSEPKPKGRGLAMLGAYAAMFGSAAVFGVGLVAAVIGGVTLGGLMGLGHLGGKKRRKAYLAERRQLFLAESTTRQPPSEP